MGQVLTADGLDEVIGALRAEGRQIIGPRVQDGVITHDLIDGAADLPAGWTEEQDGGRYRLAPTGTDEVFAYSSPATAWKRYLSPERTLLIRARRNGDAIDVIEPEPETPSVAFFGIRSCDLAALSVLDKVFLDPDATDPTYAANRADVFIVAAACAHPGGTCFCASMDTGPSPRSGYDLAIAELYADGQHTFLVESGSERGEALLARVSARPASATDQSMAEQTNADAVAAMGRRLDPADPPLAAQHDDHERWDDVAERCLSCGNCTMACPTCFCSTTEDGTDLAGDEAQRWRVWDSCFTIDYSHLYGGSVRTSTKARYRQWLLHKLVTWHDQFGSSGCVGCGRCITWCPVGIDLTAEIAALAQAPAGGKKGPS
ncbi:MAG: 4Fe-4S dicluster domain-containing protein [Acidimicrobiales bacterium]